MYCGVGFGDPHHLTNPIYCVYDLQANISRFICRKCLYLSIIPEMYLFGGYAKKPLFHLGLKERPQQGKEEFDRNLPSRTSD